MSDREEIVTFVKFTLVGILGAFVGGAIITYFTGRIPPDASPLAYIIPYLLSVEAGILVTFYPNDVWVFRQENYKLGFWGRLLAYHGALFSGFIVQTMVFGGAALLGLSISTSYWLGVGAAALWNYIVSRKAVFAGEEDEDSDIRGGSPG